MEKEHNNTFQMIADYEGDIRHLFEMAPQGEVPILATRNMVLFPGVIAPILVGRPASIRLVRKFQEDSDAIIGIFCQKDPSMDTPSGNDLYEYGVIDGIIREPLGGAHHNPSVVFSDIDEMLVRELRKFKGKSGSEIAKDRYEKFRHIDRQVL